jgi:hypothetical protein
MNTDDDSWKAAHEEALAKRRPTALPVVFHYSSLASVVGILTSKQLWLTTSATMNDHSEGQWLLHVLTDHLANRALLTGVPMTDAEANTLNAFWQVTFRGTAPKAYLACFSADGDLLSQWRAYADDGLGAAIGFDPNSGRLPIVDAPPHSNAGPDFECTLNEVSYLTDDQRRYYVSLLEVALEGGVGSAGFLNAQVILSTERWRTKNPAFAEEREWRIINLPLEFDGDVGGGKTTISAVSKREFRANGGHLSSFYRLPFTADAVVEIVLGPRSSVDSFEFDALLRDNGYTNVSIRPSKATYRR